MRVFSTAYFFSLTSSHNNNTPWAADHSSADYGPFLARKTNVNDGANAKAKSDQARSLPRDTLQRRRLFATKDLKLRWPEHKVYYTLADFPVEENRQRIRNALQELNNSLRETCFSFVEVEKNFTGPKVVVIRPPEPEGGCYSSAGCYACISVPKIQYIGFGDSCLRYPSDEARVIKHEFLHAAGLFHTHRRPDRDQYLEVLDGHIQPKFKKDNFDIRKDGDTFKLPFDYESLMSYKQSDFAIEAGSVVLKVKPQSTIPENVIPQLQANLGHYQNASKGDVETVAAMYGKHPNCPTGTSVTGTTNQQVHSSYQNGQYYVTQPNANTSYQNGQYYVTQPNANAQHSGRNIFKNTHSIYNR